jgi:hypothetical protein
LIAKIQSVTFGKLDFTMLKKKDSVSSSSAASCKWPNFRVSLFQVRVGWGGVEWGVGGKKEA